VTDTLLLDNSAWARLADPALTDARASEIADSLEAGRIATCLPFLLEAGYSARSARDLGELLDELVALPRFDIDEMVERRALDAQRQLARAGHHRLPPVDLIVAAIADRHSIGVLHYDRDYDLIAEKTHLDFESSGSHPRAASDTPPGQPVHAHLASACRRFDSRRLRHPVPHRLPRPRRVFAEVPRMRAVRVGLVCGLQSASPSSLTAPAGAVPGAGYGYA
jgi:predicted nucleic acid-binding protein